MKVTLLAINAKYVHSSLAVWFLAGGIAAHSKQCHEVDIAEATINQDADDIIARISEARPDVIGISTYIWNAGKLPDLLNRLRKQLPHVTVVLGGPEASHNPAVWLDCGADYVLCGEGERSLPALLDALAAHNTAALRDLSGLCFCSRGNIRLNPQTALPDEFINPYNDAYFEALGGRMAYIETSRGCPFRCAYCLSGGSGVRFFPLDTVKAQIDKLAKSGTQTIKFVDRTFNCHSERAFDLLAHIIGLRTDCCFHFEAAADLFDKSTIALLNTAAPGKIQLEIGLQSFHQPTLDAVSRKTDPCKTEENIRKLLSRQNIHLHIDLIAGLPYETLAIFKDSFDRAYTLGAHTLQLGFLKLLHGSRLRAQAEALGITYQKEPPYEITGSPWLGEAELATIKRAENALQHTYNKGRFLSMLRYVLSVSGLRPFALFQGLGEAVLNHATPLDAYAGQVYAYCAGLPNVDAAALRDCMICDLLETTKGKTMPDFLKSHGEKRRLAVTMAEKQLGHVIDHDEAAVLSSGEVVYVDSAIRHPVTGLYALHRLPRL